MRKTVWIEKLTGGYSVRYYDAALSKRREWVADYPAALRRKNEIQGTLLAAKQGLIDPNLKPSDVFRIYLKELEETHRPATLELKRGAIESFIDSLTSMSSLSTGHIKKYKTDLLSNYSVTTASIRLRQLRAFVRWAHKEKYIAENTFLDISIPKSAEVGRKLELEELHKIISCADKRFKPFLILAIYTGCRRGELYKANWTEFDLDNATWSIPKEHAKTNTARIVPLAPECVNALRDMEATGPLVFQDYVLRTPQWYMKKALKMAGIEGRVRLHDLRHTFVSHWSSDPRKLADMIGWTSLEMLKRYSHFKTEDIRTTSEAFSIGAKLRIA